MDVKLGRLSKLLRLSVQEIKAYCEPQRHKPFFVPLRGHKQFIDEQLQVRPMTLKVDAASEEAKLPDTNENELYRQWQEAIEGEKPKLVDQLFVAVLKHAHAAIWNTLHDSPKDLAHDSATDVITQLSDFRGDSKFSTWSHRIILNHCFQHIREQQTARNRFYSSTNPEDDFKLRDRKAEANFDAVEREIDFGPLKHLIDSLPKKDYVLLNFRLQGMTIAEAAAKFREPEDATESRWRRLQSGLKKKIKAKSDGK